MKKNDRVLVTGASGFIGSHLSRYLLKKGYRVVALHRRKDQPRVLKELGEQGAELLRCDLVGERSLYSCVDSVSKIVHAAGLTSDWGDPEEFSKANVDATRKLLKAAIEQGVETFIYISSVAVHGFGEHVNTTEDGPYYEYVSDYQRTKKEAEDFVLKANDKEIAATVIRPGNVYGPGDTTTSYPIFNAIQNGIMGYIGTGDTLTCPIYIGDLLQAVETAMVTSEARGRVFNITGGERVTWRELLEYAAELLKEKLPSIHIAPKTAKAGAKLLRGLYGGLGVEASPPLTIYRIQQMLHNYHFSIERAQRVLNYRPQMRWREGYGITVEAYRASEWNNSGIFKKKK